MNGYGEIVDQQQADALTRRMAGFHDALVKELHYVTRSRIDGDRSMLSTPGRDLRVLVQSQWDLVACELLCVGVLSVELRRDDQDAYAFDDTSWSGEIRVEPFKSTSEERRITVEIDRDRIACCRLFVAERPEWTGARARFGAEVPSPTAVAADLLDEVTWQCPVCREVFDVVDGAEYAWCPECPSQLCWRGPHGA